MICISEELINKALKRDREKGFVFSHKSLSNKFLDRMFNNYYCVEECECFYDSEPEIDRYISDIAYMYDFCTEEDIFRTDKEYFTSDYILKTYGKEYDREEARRASEFSKTEYAKYENSYRRIEFCNWQDPYSAGIWGMSQKEVDNIAKRDLKEFRKIAISKKKRIYCSKKDDEIRIFLYGRDVLYHDLWFIFKKLS